MGEVVSVSVIILSSEVLSYRHLKMIFHGMRRLLPLFARCLILKLNSSVRYADPGVTPVTACLRSVVFGRLMPRVLMAFGNRPCCNLALLTQFLKRINRGKGSRLQFLDPSEESRQHALDYTAVKARV